MIVNGFAVLDGFLALLRLVLGLLVVGLAVRSWRETAADGSSRAGSSREGAASRAHLLLLSAGVLLGLNVIAWPLLYTVWQSYVPQWPGVMCIYGVTRIGSGSSGASRFLPTLVALLEISKPAIVFLSGGWLSVYLLDRRTPTGPMRRRLWGLMIVVGLLSVGDALCESTYLLIPKREEALAAGCCTTPLADAARAGRFEALGRFSPQGERRLILGTCATQLIMIVGLARARHATDERLRRNWIPALVLGAAVSTVFGALLLREVIAPAILGLPYHRCVYDLLPRAPETVLGIGLFVLGVFAVGWSALVAGLSGDSDFRPWRAAQLRELLFVGLVGYTTSSVLFAVEWFVA